MTNLEPPGAGDSSLSIQKAEAIYGRLWFASVLILLALFAWPTLRSELATILERVAPEQVRDLALFAYIASWLLAMWVDLRVQRSVYEGDVGKLRIFASGVGSSVLLIAAGIILVLFRQSTTKLAVAIDILLIVNFLGWLQVRTITGRLIATTLTSLKTGGRQDSIIDRLDVIGWYIGGRWQLYRFATLLIADCIFNIIALSDWARDSIAWLICLAAPSFPEEKLATFLPDISILLFVVIAEAWSWSMRIAAVNRMRNLGNSLLLSQPRLAEYLMQFFDQQFKAVNYLMVAHGAALLATVTVVKDFLSSQNDSSDSKGLALTISNSIASLAGYFSWGLALAVLAYVTLSIARNSVMFAVLFESQNSRKQIRSHGAWMILCCGSALLLLAGVFTAAAHVSGIAIPG